MKFILGTKQKMTQIFDDSGTVQPATIISAWPLIVTDFKDSEKDGYASVQIGAGERNKKHINKAQQGQFGKFGNFAKVVEARGFDHGDLKTGDKIDVDTFEVGDVVQVSAVSKAKGFQGVVKRHGFKGGRRSHGNKHHERTPGSIGATGPARVFKGVRMAGRMGGDRTTVKNLKILQIDTDTNTILVSGAVPGRRGTLIEIRGKKA
jgi:large subunit ribosomal protein L3